ncbi:MAG: hypothetical protein PHR09_04245 [Bacilli bacterium]|nr:hypothetical protein [Bacilli bacterium]
MKIADTQILSDAEKNPIISSVMDKYGQKKLSLYTKYVSNGFFKY